jgi:hypothetical protein
VKRITRSCHGKGNKKGSILRCHFHPLKPALACALGHGEIAIFTGSKSSSSLKNWEKKFWRVPVDTSASKDAYAPWDSGVTTIEWNVRLLVHIKCPPCTKNDSLNSLMEQCWPAD